MQARILLLFLLVFASNVAAVNSLDAFLSSILSPVINFIDELLGPDDNDTCSSLNCPLGLCSCGDGSTNCYCTIQNCSVAGLYGCSSLGGLQCCDNGLGEFCTNLLADPSNCGSCGGSCSIGNEVCYLGQCTTCGNGSCEQELGENCFNCADCACTNGSCQQTSPGSGEYYCS